MLPAVLAVFNDEPRPLMFGNVSGLVGDFSCVVGSLALRREEDTEERRDDRLVPTIQSNNDKHAMK